MKVRELIERLNAFDPETEVSTLYDDGFTQSEVTEVYGSEITGNVVIC